MNVKNKLLLIFCLVSTQSFCGDSKAAPDSVGGLRSLEDVSTGYKSDVNGSGYLVANIFTRLLDDSSLEVGVRFVDKYLGSEIFTKKSGPRKISSYTIYPKRMIELIQKGKGRGRQEEGAGEIFIFCVGLKTHGADKHELNSGCAFEADGLLRGCREDEEITKATNKMAVFRSEGKCCGGSPLLTLNTNDIFYGRFMTADFGESTGIGDEKGE